MNGIQIGYAAVGLMAALAAAPVAHGQTFSSAGGLTFSDWLDGTGDPMIVSISVPIHGTISSVTAATIFDFSHTWIGDVAITLRHNPSGTSLTLMDRPGVPDNFFGNPDAVEGTYTYADGGMPFPEFGFGDVVPVGTYAPEGPGNFTVFNGLDMFGSWSLIMGDFAGRDIGQYSHWSLSIVAVPCAPGAALLLGAMPLGGRSRRRR